MEIKVVSLLGNGFNIGLRNFLFQIGEQKVARTLTNITNLWNRFDEILSNLKNRIPNIETDEQALEYVYTILDFFKFRSSLQKYKYAPLEQCLKQLEEDLNNEIISSIKEIAYSFFYLEKEEKFYKNLKRALGNFRISINILGDIFTTNYDGIAEILFKLTHGGLGEDLFRGCDPIEREFVCFNPGIGKETNYLIHLHGSYKIWFLQNEFIKIRGQNFYSSEKIRNFLESNGALPVIIFNAPSRKKDHIKQSFILNTYYKIFANNLLNANILIIWGNSFRNDPHITDLIKRRFLSRKEKDRKRKVIIVNIESESILQQLSLENEEDYYFINAEKIPFNEIPNEIERILNEMNKL